MFAPNSKENELIVDFELIQPSSQTDIGNVMLIYSTNFNDIYMRDIQLPDQEELLFSNRAAKSLVQDHYISLIHYFKDCDKLFTVS